MSNFFIGVILGCTVTVIIMKMAAQKEAKTEVAEAKAAVTRHDGIEDIETIMEARDTAWITELYYRAVLLPNYLRSLGYKTSGVGAVEWRFDYPNHQNSAAKKLGVTIIHPNGKEERVSFFNIDVFEGNYKPDISAPTGKVTTEAKAWLESNLTDILDKLNRSSNNVSIDVPEGQASDIADLLVEAGYVAYATENGKVVIRRDI